MSDPYVIVRGGLVTNDPTLPVLDLDVLDSDFPDDDTADEVRDLIERARVLGVTSVVTEAKEWLVNHGYDPDQEEGQ